MNSTQIISALLAWVVIVYFVFRHTGFDNISNCFKLWLSPGYWTSYNIVEAASWLAKAAIIIPGLIFGVQVWELYWIALLTSMGLIWASNHKLLPSVVAFNVIWAWISCMVLAQHLVN
jgi:hypothetical protein